jgi:hypothetical protein
LRLPGKPAPGALVLDPVRRAVLLALDGFLDPDGQVLTAFQVNG